MFQFVCLVKVHLCSVLFLDVAPVSLNSSKWHTKKCLQDTQHEVNVTFDLWPPKSNQLIFESNLTFCAKFEGKSSKLSLYITTTRMDGRLCNAYICQHTVSGPGYHRHGGLGAFAAYIIVIFKHFYYLAVNYFNCKANSESSLDSTCWLLSCYCVKSVFNPLISILSEQLSWTPSLCYTYVWQLLDRVGRWVPQSSPSPGVCRWLTGKAEGREDRQ